MHAGTAATARTRQLVFITHPNVVIDADVPVPRWPLSERGRERMRLGLRQPWIADLSAIYCSDEQKAIDTAAIVAQHRGLPVHERSALGENDRSATGFLPPAEFERMADAFFARPDASVRGWERAIDAQRRIVTAVQDIVASDSSDGLIAIVSHGAVGTLLYCHLAGESIDRRWDQPANGGGNFFGFSMTPPRVRGWWQAVDAASTTTPAETARTATP